MKWFRSRKRTNLGLNAYLLWSNYRTVTIYVNQLYAISMKDYLNVYDNEDIPNIETFIEVWYDVWRKECFANFRNSTKWNKENRRCLMVALRLVRNDMNKRLERIR